MKYCKALVNLFITIVGVLAVVFLLPRLLAFFAPFVIGWIIALLAGAPVRFFEEKMRIRRKAGSAFVIILVIAIIVTAIYLLGGVILRECGGLVESLPEIIENTKSDMEHIAHKLYGIYEKLPEGMQNGLEDVGEELSGVIRVWIGNLSSPTLTALSNFAMYLPTLTIGIIMSLLSAYLFVAEKKEIDSWLTTHVPKGIQKRYSLLRKSLFQAVGGYLKAQFRIEFWIYLLVVLGLTILKVKYVLLVSLGIAILDFLPFFGTGTVMIPWAVIKFFAGDYKMAIGLLITWGVSQLARQVIQPGIVGDSIGVKPLPTLFLLYVGYRLGGVLGMIVAVPAGLILFSLFEAGFFDTTLQSCRILLGGLNRFRRLEPEVGPEEETGGASEEKK